MVIRRLALTLGSAAVLLSAAVSFAQAPSTAPRKLSNAEKKEIQTVLKLVDDATAGQPMRNDLGLSWAGNDFLKAQGNKQYVPFTVSYDASKVAGGKMTFYWRVISKDAPVPVPVAVAAPAPAKDAKKDDSKDKKPEYAYEDLNTIMIEAGAPGTRLSRSFTVPQGNYDVIIVAKELTPEKAKKGDPEPKVSLIKQSVTVPDFWNAQLTTSSVIVAERIDPLPAPLNPDQQGVRPYALGAMEIVPAASTKFTKKNELSTFLLIYNAKVDASNKPDVSVEYNFYAKQAGGEKFFNKTNPQNLNAQTLPAQFDFAAGHQLQSGQAVPLASFPEGDYRLEITVTDKLDSNKVIKRDVNFSVAGS